MRAKRRQSANQSPGVVGLTKFNNYAILRPLKSRIDPASDGEENCPPANGSLSDDEWLQIVEQLLALRSEDFEAVVLAVRFARRRPSS